MTDGMPLNAVEMLRVSLNGTKRDGLPAGICHCPAKPVMYIASPTPGTLVCKIEPAGTVMVSTGILFTTGPTSAVL